MQNIKSIWKGLNSVEAKVETFAKFFFPRQLKPKHGFSVAEEKGFFVKVSVVFRQLFLKYLPFRISNGFQFGE